MNTSILKRIFLWVGIVVILGLIVVGAAILAIKNQPDASSVSPLNTPVSSADHILGNPEAKVTLVEYADFECPACEAYYPLIKQLTTDYKDKVRFVYRHFPLPQHANAIPTALATEAASNQGKFWEMHDIIFDKHEEWQDLKDPTSVLVGYAKQLNLDIPRFQSDMNSGATKKIVDDDKASAVAENLPGTPSFFVNGTYIKNPQTYQDFKAILDNALAQTK